MVLSLVYPRLCLPIKIKNCRNVEKLNKHDFE